MIMNLILIDLRFPVPGDCGRLVTCVNGHPRLITCGDDKLFDSETLSCLDKDELPHWYAIKTFAFFYVFISFI